MGNLLQCIATLVIKTFLPYISNLNQSSIHLNPLPLSPTARGPARKFSPIYLKGLVSKFSQPYNKNTKQNQNQPTKNKNTKTIKKKSATEVKIHPNEGSSTTHFL